MRCVVVHGVLNLGNLNLRELLLPDSKEFTTSVKTLQLHRNKLCFLPDSVCHLDNLSILEATHNMLMDLPAQLHLLSNLKILDLRQNNLEVLPDNICTLSSLAALYVSDNFLTDLPSRLGTLSALRILALDNNDLCRLPNSFVLAPSLTLITVDGNPHWESPPLALMTGDIPTIRLYLEERMRIEQQDGRKLATANPGRAHLHEIEPLVTTATTPRKSARTVGIQTRKSYLRSRHAAVCIQRYWRGYRAKKLKQKQEQRGGSGRIDSATQRLGS